MVTNRHKSACLVALILLAFLVFSANVGKVHAAPKATISGDKAILENDEVKITIDRKGGRIVSWVVKSVGMDIITRERYPYEWCPNEPWPGTLFKSYWELSKGPTSPLWASVNLSFTFPSGTMLAGLKVSKGITIYTTGYYVDVYYYLENTGDKPVTISATWDPKVGFSVEWACMFGASTDDDKMVIKMGDVFTITKLSWQRAYGCADIAMLFDNDTYTDPETGVAGLVNLEKKGIYAVWMEYSISAYSIWTSIRFEFESTTIPPGKSVRYAVRIYGGPIDKTELDNYVCEGLYERICTKVVRAGIRPEEVTFYTSVSTCLGLALAGGLLALRRKLKLAKHRKVKGL